jgi:hypothetical protein
MEGSSAQAGTGISSEVHGAVAEGQNRNRTPLAHLPFVLSLSKDERKLRTGGRIDQ